MSNYGNYPNPNLCDKYGVHETCNTCIFNGKCPTLDKLYEKAVKSRDVGNYKK